MINVLHINGNYVGTALHQTMIEHLDNYTNNQVFAPIYPITPDQLSVKPNDNVIISQCYNKRDRLIFTYKQHKIMKSLEKNVDVRSFDCVHAYTLFTDGNCAYCIKKKYGIPYIVAVRDTDVNHFFKKAIHLRQRGLRIMRNAYRIIFLSETYRRQLLDEYVPEKYKSEIKNKSLVIPNGIDDIWYMNLFKDRNLNETESRIASKQLNLVYAGVITQRKNLLTTAEAIDLLIAEGWKIHFTVIGQAIDKQILNTLLNYSFVEYHEKMPMLDLISYYRNNDIFVMPSITETFGLTYAEALTQMMPVIYTKGQGFDGQFPEGVVGYSVVCTDKKDVAEKIVDTAFRYSEISKNCIAASSKFRWDTIVLQYESLYNQCLDR